MEEKGMQHIVGTTGVLSSLDHMTTFLECVLESLIPSQVDINNMQFGFMFGYSTRAAVYTFLQMQVKN